MGWLKVSVERAPCPKIMTSNKKKIPGSRGGQVMPMGVLVNHRMIYVVLGKVTGQIKKD